MPTQQALIVLFAGLPGTGKSTLGEAVAHATGGHILNKDRIRAALFGPNQISYSREQDDFCQTIMLQSADFLLQRGVSVPFILDGRTFSRRYQIEAIRTFADERKLALAIIECICSDELAKARLEADQSAGIHLAANRSFRLYQSLKAQFEPIAGPKLTLDTAEPIDQLVEQCLRYLDQISRMENREHSTSH
jgi:predicted kinase